MRLRVSDWTLRQLIYRDVDFGGTGDHGRRHGDLRVRASRVESAVFGLHLQRDFSVRMSEGEC